MKKTVFLTLIVASIIVACGCSPDKSSDSQTVQTDAATKAAAAATPKSPEQSKIPADVQSKMPAVAPGVGGGK